MSSLAVSSPPATKLIERLEQSRAERGAAVAVERLELLKRLEGAVVDDSEELIRFHDTLLFLRAYPDDAAVLRVVEKALEGVAGRVAGVTRDDGGDSGDGGDGGAAAAASLLDSGLAGTRNVYTYSWAMVRLLVRQHPGDLEIAWDEWEDSSGFYALLSAVSLYAETPGVDDERTDGAVWLDCARAGRKLTDLEVLLEILESSPHAPEAREGLYDSMKMPVEWRLRRPMAAITSSYLRPRRTQFHGEAWSRAAPELARHARTPLPIVERLSPRDAASAITLVTAAMSVRNREIYPLAHPEPLDVTRVTLERGLEILVYGIEPRRRLLLETAHGHLVLKNGVPVGYAVSSVLGSACEVALNVYEAFRQGESALWVAELLRVFHQLFGPEFFFVPRRQFGFDNEEGIATGAYWFYDKLGFRSIDPTLRQLADREREKIRATRGYRSSPATLRRLATEDLGFALRAGHDASAIVPVASISLAVTDWIARRYAGDRGRAQAAAEKLAMRWLGLAGDGARGGSPEIQLWLTRWAPLIALIPDRAKWSREERAALLSIVRAKAGATESGGVGKMRRHRRWMEYLNGFAARPDLF